MCWIVLIATFNAFLFVAFLRYMYFDNQFTKDEWDLSTVTVDDYSVEMPLKRDSILDWSKDEYANKYKPDGIAFNLALKMHLTEKVTKYLNDFLNDESKVYKIDELIKHKRSRALMKGLTIADWNA
jgi:hypothetical protein